MVEPWVSDLIDDDTEVRAGFARELRQVLEAAWDTDDAGRRPHRRHRRRRSGVPAIAAVSMAIVAVVAVVVVQRRDGPTRLATAPAIETTAAAPESTDVPPPTSGDTPATTATAAVPLARLIGRLWVVTSVDDVPLAQVVLPSFEVTDHNTILGSDSCNDYSYDPATGALESTAVACTDGIQALARPPFSATDDGSISDGSLVAQPFGARPGPTSDELIGSWSTPGLGRWFTFNADGTVDVEGCVGVATWTIGADRSLHVELTDLVTTLACGGVMQDRTSLILGQFDAGTIELSLRADGSLWLATAATTSDEVRVVTRLVPASATTASTTTDGATALRVDVASGCPAARPFAGAGPVVDNTGVAGLGDAFIPGPPTAALICRYTSLHANGGGGDLFGQTTVGPDVAGELAALANTAPTPPVGHGGCAIYLNAETRITVVAFEVPGSPDVDIVFTDGGDDTGDYSCNDLTNGPRDASERLGVFLDLLNATSPRAPVVCLNPVPGAEPGTAPTSCQP